MAKIVENSKGFQVLTVSAREIITCGGYGVCDHCNYTPSEGYYAAALNSWLCPNCYKEWLERAKRYEEDKLIEQKNFDYYCKLLKI